MSFCHNIENAKLIIYSDGAKSGNDQNRIDEVRIIVKNIKFCRDVQIIERDKNYGLAKSIIEGVTEQFRNFNSLIILEDDMEFGSYFLRYMSDALQLYDECSQVGQVVGFSGQNSKNLPETYFLKEPDNLGWGTWSRVWSKCEWDPLILHRKITSDKSLIYEFNSANTYPYLAMLEDQINKKIDSWAIRFRANMFLNRKLTLYPRESLVLHIGNEGTGTHYHMNKYDPLNIPITERPIKLSNIELSSNETAEIEHMKFLQKFSPSLVQRLVRKFTVGKLL